MAEKEEVLITRHGKPAGILIGFESEDDWFDYQLESDPRFLSESNRPEEACALGEVSRWRTSTKRQTGRISGRREKRAAPDAQSDKRRSHRREDASKAPDKVGARVELRIEPRGAPRISAREQIQRPWRRWMEVTASAEGIASQRQLGAQCERRLAAQ